MYLCVNAAFTPAFMDDMNLEPKSRVQAGHESRKHALDFSLRIYIGLNVKNEFTICVGPEL